MRSDDDCYHSDDHVDYSLSPISFPKKLYILLENNNSDLIHWSPNGLCFRIRDPDRFARETVPKYFKQSKLTSFQRQLNLYGFRRIARGEDVGCYFHPKFHQGRKDLLKEIKRLPPKGSLMTYEEVLEAHARLSAKRKSSEHAETSLPLRSFPSGLYGFSTFHISPQPTSTVLADHDRKNTFVQSSPSSLADDSSISSWCSDRDSLDLSQSLDLDSDLFLDLFSLSHIESCNSSPHIEAVEPKEYIPTYEEALIYGLISH